MSIIEEIDRAGQSLWYDNIERSKLDDGSLAAMIADGAIKGITSNPSIFQKAIATSKDYDVSLKPMSWSGMDAESIFWQLAVEDIHKAADLFKPVYSTTGGKDGFVSLEVNPLLAYDTVPTIAEAKKLWDRVNQPNLMIKIPATKEGIPAVRKAIAAGINVNVTLIFSRERYAEVMEAYLSGLEDRVNEGNSVNNIASVASFFVSRMDTKIDSMLENLLKGGKIDDRTYTRLAGKAAIANARLAYRQFEETFNSKRFEELQRYGAQVQRPLWASTSTKNPQYRDVLYVEELIAPDSVNTVPPATLEAFLAHGQVQTSIYKDSENVRELFAELESIGISIKQVTDELEVEGVQAFSAAYTSLLNSVELRRVSASEELGSLSEKVRQQIASLEEIDFVPRFFAGDPSLWTSDVNGQEEIKNRMNWISTPYDMRTRISDIIHLARDYRDKGFTDAVLLGMGGSSLAPEVISKILGTGEQGLNLKMLDSTDPEQVQTIAENTPAEKTLYIVASKSGTTGEINAFLDYFWHRTERFDPQNTGAHFIAITDPGTKLANLAASRNFSGIFLGDPQVGGRNSALTSFGMVPAALLGIDLGKLTQNAVNMADMCNEGRPLRANPGIVLGAILGAAALDGKNKVTLITDGKWAPFGDWLEQLVAESSGKNGKGILPVANEPEMSLADYHHDRIFVHLEQSEEKHDFVEHLKQAGHPVISLQVDEDEDLAGQFYLWEIAVATACAVIGVNSFDQPDVQDAKLRTLTGLDEFRKLGKFPEGVSSKEFPGARILTTLPSSLVTSGSLHQMIEGFVEHYLKKTEYIAINAFLPKNSENEVGLQEFRRQLGEKYHIATTLGFGPRYLHSTGQFHKGGPNTGLFLLITAQRENDLDIPGQGISFGVMQRAQAIGDLQALQAKARKVLWIDLNAPDVSLLLKN